MDSGYLAFALLLAALTAFLISTRQFRLWMRVVLLLAGVGLLVTAGVLIGSMEGHSGLLRMVVDVWVNRADPSESALGVALGRNKELAGRFVLPLLDIFVVSVGVLGLVAVIALTPGTLVERIGRSLKHGLMGLMLGSALTLTIVTTGFGGPVRQRAYVAFVEDYEAIHDGDTFSLGDVSIRLFGVDAPERDQICHDGVNRVKCGLRARDFLARMLVGHVVECVPHRENAPPLESFGRPLMRCYVRGSGDQERYEIGVRLLEEGWAGLYPDRHPLEFEADAQSGAQFGFSAMCGLDPKEWRRNPEARAALGPSRHDDIADNPFDTNPFVDADRCRSSSLTQSDAPATPQP